MDSRSQNERLPQTGRRAVHQVLTVAGLLLLALIVRVVYANGLPLNVDEMSHLPIARTFSLYPSTFYLPLGNSVTNHPNGILYLIAAANWIGRGSVLVIRLCFIPISLAGLLGVYYLAKSYFGYRAGIAAMFLASVDHALVAFSCQFHEMGTFLALVPWTLLVMQACVDRGKWRDWVLLGLLCGVGWNVYQLFLFLPMAFLVYLVLSGQLLSVIRQRRAYVALGLFLALIAPNVFWNLSHQWAILQYGGGKAGPFGVCPRFAVIYVGGLLLCLNDPLWIAMYAGDKVDGPIQVNCHWITGIVYLACLVYSICRLRSGRFGLLLAAVLVPAAVCTLVAVDEPYNDSRWASSTLIPVMCLTGWVVASAMEARIGKLMVAVGAVCLMFLLVSFLNGPKWGYFCPEWERVYIGQVRAGMCQLDAIQDPSQQARVMAEIRESTSRALARNSRSVVAWYYRGLFAQTEDERQESFQKVLLLNPDYPLVRLSQASTLAKKGDLTGARDILENLAAQTPDFSHARKDLAEVQYRLGQYGAAIASAQELLAVKPETNDLYRLLYYSYDAMGDTASADRSLKIYAAKQPFGPASAYLFVAEQAWKQGSLDKSRKYLKCAVQERSWRPEDHARMGVLFGKFNQIDQAIDHFETAVKFGSVEPNVYCNLGMAMEATGRSNRAAEYYRRAIELNPAHGEAQLRLGILLAARNMVDEAREHLEAAKRLGMTVPALDTSSDRSDSPPSSRMPPS